LRARRRRQLRAPAPVLRRLPHALRRRLPRSQRGARLVVADLPRSRVVMTAERRARQLLALGAAAGLAVAATALVGARAPHAGLPEGAIATVNGELVRADDYARALAALAADRRDPPGEDDRRRRRDLGDEEVAPLPDALLPPAKLREYLGETATRAALALAPGGVSDPVRSGAGFHVLRVVEREAARVPPFDEIVDAVRAQRRRRGDEEALRTALDSLRRRADVRVAERLP